MKLKKEETTSIGIATAAKQNDLEELSRIIWQTYMDRLGEIKGRKAYNRTMIKIFKELDIK